MKAWIILTIILVSTASGYVDEWNLIHFSRNEEQLRKCLEETDLPEVLKENVKDAELETYVIQKLSHWLHELTVAMESTEVVAAYLVNALETAMSTYDEDQMDLVKEAIVISLHNCTDSENSNNSSKPSRRVPPNFIQEIPEVVELLNTILIGSMYHYGPEFRYHDFSTFSQRSLSFIETALRRMNNAHELFDELLSMWNRRARIFYDCRNYHEYIGHSYHDEGPYAALDPNYCNRRRLVNYTVRNRLASIGDRVFEMTSYHAVNWDDPTTSRIFSVNSTVPMTKSRYYYESRKNQFLVTLFFYLELVDRELTNSGKRRYTHPSFPKDLMTLLYSSIANYGPYLETVQRRELSYGFANRSAVFSSLVQALQPGDNIDEFDLLMMFWYRVRSGRVATTYTTENLNPGSDVFKDPNVEPSKYISTTTMKTTTILGNTSSTFGYEESKRGKGHVTRLPSGKFKPKNQRKSGDDDNGPSFNKEDKFSETNKFTKFMVDSNCLDLQEEKMFMVTVHETFSSSFKSQMHVEEDLIYY